MSASSDHCAIPPMILIRLPIAAARVTWLGQVSAGIVEPPRLLIPISRQIR